MNLVTTIVVAAVFLAIVISARMRQRKAIEKLVGQIRTLRQASMEQHGYSAVPANWQWPEGARALYDAASKELSEQGCLVLGDMAEQNAQGKVAGVARWFVTADRSTCGWFAAMPSAAGLRTSRFLFSEAPGSVFFLTYSGPTNIRVAQPPTIHRAALPIEQGVAAAVAEHQKLMATAGTTPSAMVQVADIGAATDLLRRLRSSIQAWRSAQPRDRLLTDDLQLILGPRFAELGPKVLKLLRG